MRVALWSAVSTKAQASSEKTSLEDQVNLGRSLIAARGWSEVAAYIVPGESRTAYISLSHAEEAIPQLKRLMDDAAAGRFDLVFVYDLNRFRNLMLQVFEALAGYNVQIYNYDDPQFQPVARPLYTPELKNAVRLNIKIHDLLSGQEVNTLAKHYREKMPNRITVKRLHPGLGLPPYGYRKPPHLLADRNAVLEIVPEEAATLRRIKDWFLKDGLSLTEITQRLNAEGIPSPRGRLWWFSIVRYVLANPFYSGVVTFGSTKRNHDKRTRTVTRTRSVPVSAVGLHQPLWDEVTHQRILDELARRAQAQPGIQTRPLSRLLRCVCGAPLWAQVTPAGKYWRCSSLQPAHTYIRDDTATAKLVHAIRAYFERVKDIPIAPPNPKADPLSEIRSIKARQSRLLDLYENEKIDKDQLNTRMDKLNALLSRAKADHTTQTAAHARAAASRQNLQTLAAILPHLNDYITHAPPREVNAFLHSFLEPVTVTKDHKFKIKFK